MNNSGYKQVIALYSSNISYITWERVIVVVNVMIDLKCVLAPMFKSIRPSVAQISDNFDNLSSPNYKRNKDSHLLAIQLHTASKVPPSDLQKYSIYTATLQIEHTDTHTVFNPRTSG